MPIPTALRTEADATAAFIALGHTAVSVGAEMRGYLEAIMGHIKAGFQQRGHVRRAR
jgi:hypothetical protein